MIGMIMKKKYTKKQIVEAINYWNKQLKKMNESVDVDETSTLRYLKDGIDGIEDEDTLNREVVFIANNDMLELFAKDLCNAVGVDFDQNYSKIEAATWGSKEYAWAFEDVGVESQGDHVTFTGMPAWADAYKV